MEKGDEREERLYDGLRHMGSRVLSLGKDERGGEGSCVAMKGGGFETRWRWRGSPG